VFASAASLALLRLSTRAGAAAEGPGGTEAASHSFEANKENMKTTSALLLACAGSAAAFAPQASNKVRQTKRSRRGEACEMLKFDVQARGFRFGAVWLWVPSIGGRRQQTSQNAAGGKTCWRRNNGLDGIREGRDAWLL